MEVGSEEDKLQGYKGQRKRPMYAGEREESRAEERDVVGLAKRAKEKRNRRKDYMETG